MLKSRKIVVDELTPVAIFSKIRDMFSVKSLFESAINGPDANYSFIFLGAKERIIDDFGKLKDRYRDINKDYYKELSKELSIPFVDGFIGFVGYDMIKVFEPTLAKHMENLEKFEDTPDMDLVRPLLTLVFNHRNFTLTMLSEDETLFDTVIDKIFEPYTHNTIKKGKKFDDGRFWFGKETFCNIIEDAKENIKASRRDRQKEQSGRDPAI